MWSAPGETGAVGVSEIRLEDREGSRHLDGYVWYPTSSATAPALIVEQFLGANGTRR
jgi:hypothetical protein